MCFLTSAPPLPQLLTVQAPELLFLILFMCLLHEPVLVPETIDNSSRAFHPYLHASHLILHLFSIHIGARTNVELDLRKCFHRS